MRATQVTVGSDRILKVDGRRFFPIGARHIPNGADPKIIRDTGFNCIRWVAFDTDTIASSDINRLIDADIMFYPYISDRGDFAHNKAQKMKDLSSLVDLVKGCPLLLCYEQRNEPTYHYRNWAKLKGSPKGMKEGSDLIRSLDPFHPIRLGHGVCNLVSTIKSFNDSADMIGCNPYVIYDQRMRANCATRMDGRISDSPDQTLSAVGEYTSKMMRAAEGRPVWMQLQACSNEDWYNPDIYTPELKGQGIYPHNRLFPSYYQMRFMAFDAIVRGATAMEWSMYGLSTDDGMGRCIQDHQ